jgi:hypothetical protein
VRRHAVWVVTLPLVLASVCVAHAIANALVGAPDGEVFSSAAAGQGLLLPIGVTTTVVLVAALTARALGLWGGSSRAGLVAVPFWLLPPVVFLTLELVEAATAQGPLGLRELVSATFAVGLALQLPMAVVAYLVARALLRLSDDLHERLVRRSPPKVATDRLNHEPPTDDVIGGRKLLCGLMGRAPPVAAVLVG